MRFFPRLSTVRGSIFRPVIGLSMAVIALQSASAMEGTAVFA
ncbi:hemin ABC transporter substrate-binding protein, partial [Mesorhizobium sp. M7A.F.Ca.CA.001.10.2.1]